MGLKDRLKEKSKLKKLKKQLKKANAEWPVKLKLWPEDKLNTDYRPENIKEVWRSRTYLVQIFHAGESERITVCRADVIDSGWADKIPWEDLQRLKRECGRGHLTAVELYPPDYRVVNIANMRHLFILRDIPDYCW